MVLDFNDYVMKVSGHSFHDTNGYVTMRAPAATAEGAHVHHVICDTKEPEGGQNTVDHVNRVTSDNRRKNLRSARQCDQIANHDSRCDKREPPRDVQEIGLTELPRGISWDATQDCFTGFDISALQQLREVSGKSYDANGTKSTRCSVVEKLASCLSAVKDAMRAYHDFFPRESELQEHADRVRLLEEYRQIAAFCHQQRPELFDPPTATFGADDPNRMDFTEFVDYVLAKVCGILGISERDAASLGGPEDQAVAPSSPALTSTSDIMIREKSTSKGETILTVLDAKYLRVWEMKNAKGGSLVNWDASDQRIHVYPELRNAFPEVRTVFGDVSKILLGEFVHHILEGHPRRKDHTIVPVNQQRNDVRAANLEELPGTGKNHKASTVIPPAGVDIGMPYIPRGVSISVDRNAYVYVVSAEDKKRKVGFTASTASERFAKEVLPILHTACAGGEVEWALRNKLYQRVTEEYFQAISDANTDITH
ncbi:MAG: hypothetical protein WDW38_006536 [Sanguina aurantia]